MPDSTDYMEDWRTQRVRDICAEFANIAPVYTKQADAFCRQAMGYSLDKVVEQFMLDLAKVCINRKDATLSYTVWIRDACNYILGERDTPPETRNSAPELEHNE